MLRMWVQCYHDDSAVTDELVEKILTPGLQPGAVDVFLDFICYSGGPLPEEMLPRVKVKLTTSFTSQHYLFLLQSECFPVQTLFWQSTEPCLPE